MPDGLAHAVRDALETLRWTTLALARSRGLEGKVEGIELRMRLGRGESAESLAEAFLREVLARLDEAQSSENLAVPNHAFCFRCESFLCSHSRPADARSVLASYEPTGRPRWVDFVSYLFDRRDARAEQVAERVAGVVAVVQEGAEVNGDRLEAFGGASPAVEVLCQVLAGPFELRAGEAEDEAAVTIQFLRVRAHGRERLLLHPIGDRRLLDPTHRSGDGDLARILAAARHELHGRRHAPAGGGPAAAALAAAHDLARDMQHHFQVRARRTRHAIERSEIGVRPTSHAFPEARSAPDAAIRVDRETGTFVLLGKNSRVHFFNAEGRHVTSVRFPGDAIRARVDTGRWRAAASAEVARFRAILGHGSGGSGGRA